VATLLDRPRQIALPRIAIAGQVFAQRLGLDEPASTNRQEANRNDHLQAMPL
jgi:hypothetical protein